MKVTVLQENLVKGVQAVSRVTAAGGQLPILTHIKIKAKREGLYLIGSDLELSVILKVGARVEKVGEVAIPARLLGEYVASLGPGKIEFIQDGDKLKLKSKGGLATLQGMSTAEFPDVPEKAKTELFSCGEELEEAIGQVGFAAATEESRPVLSGVQLKKDSEKLRVVATDGYRLSIKRLGVKFSKFKGIYIVPAKTLSEVVQLLKTGESSEIKVGLTEEGSQMVFSFGEVVLVSRLIEGEFPPFEHILPKKGESSVSLDGEELMTAVRTAAIFARESANIVRWELKSKEVVLTANSPQVGENKSKIEVKVKGKGGKIAFNSRYLMEMLSALEAGKGKGIDFEMSGALAPGLFRIEGDSSFEHVIMPVRVQEED